MSEVLVVGGGIVGLSTAYWLAKAGRDVAVVEQGPVPCPLASSADHHRLIRYPYGGDEGYTARITEAYAAWRDMWADLPADEAHYYAATGMLCVSQWAGDYTDRSREVMERLGIPFERIEGAAELSRRFPFLETANVAYGLMSEGGALMANRILSDLATWLRRQGVTVMEHAPVEAVDTARGSVWLADGRTLGADRVVVAAGIATARLVPDLGVTLTPRRTVIVYAAPPEDLAQAYAGAPCWTDLGGDTDLWGVAAVDGLPMKLGNGAMGRADPEARDRAMTGAEVRQLLAAYAGRFRGAERFRVRWHQANHWTHAPGEAFQIEEIGRVLAVSACSGHGFKFGALSGRDVAGAVGGDPLDAVRRRMQGRHAA